MNIDLKDRLDRTDLVTLFAPTLGAEKSAETVDAAIRALRIQAPTFDIEQAVSILTEMGHSPGLVGLVSRLAIARLRAGQAFRKAGGT